ncbi:hypothetical protein HGB25_02585, partial [Candidatus Saccharibacteria bacterium]|nr:hypothetical protein [Candidatus Saccharibacteria bacterium]
MSLFNNIVNFVQDFLNGTRDISSTIEEVKSGDSAPLGTTMVEGFKQTDQTTPTAPLAPP